MIPARAIAGQLLMTLKEVAPRQKSAFFNVQTPLG
jgi:hypothetical protein